MDVAAASVAMQGCWCFRFHDDIGASGLVSHLQTALKALLLVPRSETKQHMNGIASAAPATEEVHRDSQVDDTVSLQALLDQLGPAHVQELMHEALRDPEFPRASPCDRATCADPHVL